MLPNKKSWQINYLLSDCGAELNTRAARVSNIVFTRGAKPVLPVAAPSSKMPKSTIPEEQITRDDKDS
jgi:hypothetical protein